MTGKYNEKLFILDGGLSTELEAAGFKIQVSIHYIPPNCTVLWKCVFSLSTTSQGDPLWSARLLHTNPKAVVDAHYRYDLLKIMCEKCLDLSNFTLVTFINVL